MVERAGAARADASLRVAASLVGTLPTAVFSALCLARFLPLDEEARFSVGFTLSIPIWVAAICATFLVRGGGRAWLCCGGLALALGGLAFGIPG